MKKLYAVIALLLSVSCSFAQNIFFVDFATDFESIAEEMDDRRCIEIENSYPGKMLEVRGMEAKVTYQFNQGNLFQIEMVRRFENRRQALRVFEEIESYFQSILASPVGSPVEEKYYQHHVYGRTGRVFELEYKTLINEEIEIRLVSISTGNKPLQQAEHYDIPTSVNMGKAVSLTQ